MKMIHGALISLGLVFASPALTLAQAGEKDVKKLVEDVIPKEVREVFNAAKEIAGMIPGLSGVADPAEILGKLLGLSDEGVDIKAEFNRLNEHLETVKKELSRQQHAVSSGERYGKIHQAVASLMEAMTHDEQAGQFLASAITRSGEVMYELENTKSTPSSSLSVYADEGGALRYDWRLAVPELMASIALRLVVLQFDNPEWPAQPHRIEEVTKYRHWLVGHRDEMRRGMKCESQCTEFDPILNMLPGCLVSTGWCEDPPSGMTSTYQQSIIPGFEAEAAAYGGAYDILYDKMGFVELQGMIDHLDALIAQQP